MTETKKQPESEFKPIGVTPEVLLALQAPTPESARKTRPDRATWQHKPSCPGRGCPSQNDPAAHVQLTYIDARYVMQVLDTEVGPGNWQDEYQMGSDGKVAGRIGIYVEGRGWVWKGDGAGATDIEGDKGSFSDAFKRSAVKWGIARDLYEEKPKVAAKAQEPQRAALGIAISGGSSDRTRQGFSGGDKCPVHGWDWRVQPGGVSKSGKEYDPFYKCGGKTPDGRYCQEKPTNDWIEAHPIEE